LAGKEKLCSEKGISRQDAKHAKIRKAFFFISTSFVKHNQYISLGCNEACAIDSGFVESWQSSLRDS
jgi:hypothetical protein